MKQLFVLLAAVTLTSFSVCAQEVLQLEECRARALEHNKQLQIADQRIEAARYQKRSAVANFLPELSFNGAYLYNEKRLQLLDLSNTPLIEVLLPRSMYTLDIHNIYVGAFTVTQPIFMGGKIAAYNKIMDHSLELAKAKQKMAAQEVLVKTDEVYWQIVSLNHKKQLAQAFVQLLEKLHADVQALKNDGFATASDELTVSVKLNEAMLTLNKVENGITLSKMLLCQLCGMDLDTPFALAGDALLATKDEEQPLPLSIDQALANRLELSSLDIARKIYKNKEQIERSKMLPTVAAMGGYTVTNPNSFNGFKNEFGGMWNVGVMVTVPLFHFGKNLNQLKAAKVETHIMELERDEAKEKIELQIKQAYFKIGEAQKQLLITTKNLEKADQNLSHANIGFKEGVMTPTNVMEAQTAWLKANSDNIDAAIEEKLCNVYLRKALGVLAPPLKSEE